MRLPEWFGPNMPQGPGPQAPLPAPTLISSDWDAAMGDQKAPRLRATEWREELARHRACENPSPVPPAQTAASRSDPLAPSAHRGIEECWAPRGTLLGLRLAASTPLLAPAVRTTA